MSNGMSESERRLRAQVASHSSWMRTEDRSKRTAPGRRAFMERFEREVDPDGTLDAAERSQRAESARKAYFARLALKSAQTRRQRRGGVG